MYIIFADSVVLLVISSQLLITEMNCYTHLAKTYCVTTVFMWLRNMAYGLSGLS